MLAGSQIGMMVDLFSPVLVGSHWPADAQVDVVAINWRSKVVLLGECKWGAERVGREVVGKLISLPVFSHTWGTRRLVPVMDRLGAG